MKPPKNNFCIHLIAQCPSTFPPPEVAIFLRLSGCTVGYKWKKKCNKYCVYNWLHDYIKGNRAVPFIKSQKTLILAFYGNNVASPKISHFFHILTHYLCAGVKFQARSGKMINPLRFVFSLTDKLLGFECNFFCVMKKL